MARERKDIAARQLDQRGADAPDAGMAAAGASAPAPSPDLADQYRAQIRALVRALAHDAAREDHERSLTSGSPRNRSD